MDGHARAAREGRDGAVDDLRRYGAWAAALFVLLPLPLAILLSLLGVAAYLLSRALSKRSRTGL